MVGQGGVIVVREREGEGRQRSRSIMDEGENPRVEECKIGISGLFKVLLTDSWKERRLG